MPVKDKWIKYSVVAFIFIFLAALLPGLPGHQYDMFCFRNWANNINDHGLKNAYLSDTDYLPLYQYVLWVYTQFTHTNKLIWEKIAYLRLVTVLFELIGLYYIYRWVDKKTGFLLLALFSILNVAFSYNSIIWGQVDGMLSAMVFISVYYAYNRKLFLSSIWFLLAINLKLQAIIFIPVIGFLFVQHTEWVNVKKLLAGLVVLAILQYIILWPFIQTPESRHNLHEAVFGSVGRYPYMSIYAFNFWYWLFPTDGAIKLNDGAIWFTHFTYHRFGLVLFFVTSFLALFPLLKILFSNYVQNHKTSICANKLMLICALIPLLFFFCNTQMHERYPHPAFFFLTAYAFRSRDFIPYTIFSLAYFLNLEKELQWLKLENYGTMIFDASFIAGLYALVIVYLFARIYLSSKGNRNN